MSKIGGYTFSGTPNDQWKYVNTKVVSSGATALITSLEDVNVVLSAGEINVSAFKNAAGTPKDALLNGDDVLYVETLPQESEDLTTILNAVGATGFGTQMDVSTYKWIEVMIKGVTTPDATVKCYGSLDDSGNFASNDSDTLRMKELQDGTVVNGDTGVVFSGTADTILYNIEVGGMQWINFNVTAWSAGAITVKVRGFNN